MDELMKLPNVGKILARNLVEVGIKTPEALYEVGAKEAFIRIRSQVDEGACLHMLYGLEGACQGIPDRELEKSVKEELKAFYNSL